MQVYQVQNLGFDFGHLMHDIGDGIKKAAPIAKEVTHVAAQVAPMVASATGHQEIAQGANIADGLMQNIALQNLEPYQVQNLGFNFGHMMHDIGNGIKKAAPIAKEVTHVAASVAPVVGAVTGMPEIAQGAQIADGLMQHIGLQQLGAYEVQNLGFNFGHMMHDIGHGIQKAAPIAKEVTHVAAQVAPMVGAATGHPEIAQGAKMADGLMQHIGLQQLGAYEVQPYQVQNLGFDFGHMMHSIGDGIKKAAPIAKEVTHVAAQVAPMVASATGHQEIAQGANIADGLMQQIGLQQLGAYEVQPYQVQNLGFNFGHMMHDVGEGLKKAAPIAKDVLKTGVHVAAVASPIATLAGQPEITAGLMAGDAALSQWKLQQLQLAQPYEVQNLGFNFGHMMHDVGNGLKKAAPIAKQVLKTGVHVAAVASPIAAMAGQPEITAGLMAGDAALSQWKLQNMQQVYLI